MNSAARAVLDRIRGVEWRFQMFDFASSCGVAGQTSDGRRAAARFMVSYGKGIVTVDDVLKKMPQMVEKAKQSVLKQLAEGRGVSSGEVLEGNEEMITDE